MVEALGMLRPLLLIREVLEPEIRRADFHLQLLTARLALLAQTLWAAVAIEVVEDTGQIGIVMSLHLFTRDLGSVTRSIMRKNCSNSWGVSLWLLL